MDESMQDSGGARETCQGKLGNGMECARRKEFCLDLCLRKISRANVHDAFLYEVPCMWISLGLCPAWPTIVLSHHRAFSP